METKITELEDQIIRKIFEDNKCTAHFEYHDNIPKSKGNETSVFTQSMVELTLTTYNPTHGQKFLLEVFVGETREKCLEQAIEALNKIKNNYTYTVTWQSFPNEDGQKMQESYFTAKDMIEALQKFYHGKDINHKVITVFNCKLNPIS